MTKKSKGDKGLMHRCTISKSGKFQLWRVLHQTCETASQELARLARNGYTVESRELLIVGKHSPRAKCVECGGLLDSALAKKELEKRARALAIADRRRTLWAEMRSGEVSSQPAPEQQSLKPEGRGRGKSTRPSREQQSPSHTDVKGETLDCSTLGRSAKRKKSTQPAAKSQTARAKKSQQRTSKTRETNWHPEKAAASRASAAKRVKTSPAPSRRRPAASR